jgi:putative transposase
MLQGSRELGVPVHTTMQMINHVHLIVTPSDHKQLGRFVASFAQPYAQFRNRRRDSSGKLFEERYRCIPIRTEEQMTVTTAYVELNPVRARICAEPENYLWSTYSLHAGCEGGDPLIDKLWTPSRWYLSLGDEPAARSDAYRDWFEHYRARDDWSEVYRDPPSQRDQKRFERPDRRRAL